MDENVDIFIEFQEAVVGRYSLDHEIARGGMGIVFLARDVRLDRPVAMKVLAPDLAESAEMRDRFLHEARTAARLTHPNIVPIFAVEEAGDFVFFVMAYVDGQTLGDLVYEKGPLKPVDALRIIREVSWALSYAHSQGVIHRDIKPDNILIEDGSGRALVTDFGIAVIAGSEFDDSGAVFGTPEFMSPEQAVGDEAGVASDLYALGVAAYFVLNGRVPYSDAEPSRVLAKHIQGPVPRLGRDVTAGNRKLAAAIEKCLAKSPEHRPADAAELADMLSRVDSTDSSVPVPIRLFIEATKNRDGRAVLYLAAALLVGPTVAIGLITLLTGPLPAQLAGLALTAALLSTPLAIPLHRIRRIIADGYERGDLVRALEQELEKRREELRYIYGDDYQKKGKLYNRISYGLLAGAGAAVVGALVAVRADMSGLFGTLVASGTIGVLGAGLMGSLVQRRSERRWLRMIKMWKGKIGRWMFRVAGLGLRKRPPVLAAGARPTEIALGMAVSALYEALPAETRKSLGDLPPVVERLETSALQTRQRMDDLAELIGSMESEVSRHESEQKPQALADLRSQHEEASARFSDAMSALETMRIDLLRMQAGTDTVDSITENLGSARELSEQINRLLEARAEIDRDLAGD